MHRRELIGATLAAALALSARRARAEQKPKPGAGVLTVEEWARRAALLLDETKRAQDWIGAHPGDLGLAALAFDLADLRSQVAVRIAAPEKAKQAHMHLLLALENTAAAFDARVRGDEKKAAQRLAAARSEENTLNLALEAVKLKLPMLK
ncbi:MAG: hypothetical protein HYV09_12460 [Deltaproteobacteria bacterium]|nr:hypothetical protein [Deltaproteobacteria bacterium]